MSSTEIALTRPGGSVVWRVPINSRLEPDLVARGDFTGDGKPDLVFEEVRQASPARQCAGKPLDQTQLVFVDGATGWSWRPVPALDDICWQAYGYATHQWGVGTAYIGNMGRSAGAPDILLFPYWAQTGWRLRFDARMGWRSVPPVTDTISYPSTAAFDDVYGKTNVAPCQRLAGQDHCFVANSHVANGIFLQGDAGPGFLILTTNRAVIYRPDLTPTSDVVWDYPEGGGRSYGLVESYDTADGRVVTLIGGCSVAKTHDDMRTGRLSTDPCGLFHHFEWFLVRKQSIVAHAGRFFGWYGTVGLWQDRVEFPFPSTVSLVPGPSWTVFNLYRDGQWRAELLPDPSRPSSSIEVPGWYVWGAVQDRNGRTLLVATQTSATDGTSIASYVPPWQFDFLTWRRGGVVSVGHHDGIVPSLVLYPPGPDYHVSDADTFGLAVARSTPMGFGSLLVESRAGDQAYVSVPNVP